MPETTYALKILNAALVTMVPLPTYANVYVGLHSSSPGASGSFASEIVGTGYGRRYLSLTSEPHFNDSLIEWNVASAWANVTYVSIIDSSQGGNMLLYETITPINSPQPGTIIRIPVGSLTVS